MLKFALTTRWNAGRHTDGEAMVNEILEMGFDALELGYDLRMDLVPGVKKMVAEGAVEINSLHNFCPIPMGVPFGHPELWTLGDKDPRTRRNALEYTIRTIRFAAEVGAKAVVMHSGNVKMRHYTEKLVTLFNQGKQFTKGYEKTRMKLQSKREKKGAKQLPYLYEGINRLLPVLHECDIRLGIENLPTWEALPTEMEMEQLLNAFRSPHLGYWHDMGHAQIRQNLGFINHLRWLERLSPWLLGMHIHDVQPPFHDHMMPPNGVVDFSIFNQIAHRDILRVFEPTPRVPADQVVTALNLLKNSIWNTPVEAPPQ